ncbi:hypothetical protein RRG08_046739 [Elysia crispata]|uniref:Uncharacterized protein n=1 Tax=Elysia crispata TaxID=231223 RepID=A0AAE1DMR2_9GAST|nr:hypothetical protein RRG08_046739 [Elysia crispata]
MAFFHSGQFNDQQLMINLAHKNAASSSIMGDTLQPCSIEFNTAKAEEKPNERRTATRLTHNLVPVSFRHGSRGLCRRQTVLCLYMYQI